MNEQSSMLSVEHLSISFGSIRANDDVSFQVKSGEIHALLGENGAGKSTLVKMLYGVYHPDTGGIRIAGKKVVIHSPADARKLGIGLVFQDMRLIPALKVWENIALFMEHSSPLLHKERLIAQISDLSRQWGLSVDPMALVDDLSIGEWQRVELLKVLIQGAKILILDEPTSVLTPQEVDSLFAVVRRLQASGTAVIIITHKMREVREIANRVTVLRQGQVAIRDVDVQSISDGELIESMIGHAIEPERHDSLVNYQDRPILELAKVSKRRPDGTIGLSDVSLRVYPREVLGVAGISGNGQQELAAVITGFVSPDEGDIVLADHGESGGEPGGFSSKGVTAVPSDPIREMVIPGLDVASHAALWERTVGESTTYDINGASLRLEQHSRRIGLQIPDTSRIMSDLSGGNIQRVALTLALSSAKRCIVASYPTRGLDVGTTIDTRKALLKVREKGCAVVLISEDLDEILEMSDRVIVLADGRITGILSGGAMTRAGIARLMTDDSEPNEMKKGVQL
ncbi:ABC transporter [Bifidobacterium subtile]|uniref:ABC transporter n=2 Tax=Bifidobacterium subtile TaxID=77635 RepID=A0A087E8U2_9BIFI|nr:ABC transporter [Bifidobacterium subtile]